MYKKFIAFLNTKYNIDVEIVFPPIPVSITFERIMFIAKFLQQPDHKIADLEDILWLSQRTIEKDIAKLRGNTNDPIQVCGQKFVITELKRRQGKVTMASTAHPIFLTSNLTQVIITLKGLKKMSQDSAYKGYAKQMAESIWQQLSDYAKKRILYVTEHLLPDETAWYLSLETNQKDSFYSEYRCYSTEGAGCICDSLKNGKPCFIEYLTEDNGTIFYENCKVSRYTQDIVTIICNQQQIDLVAKNIIRSSYTAEGLI